MMALDQDNVQHDIIYYLTLVLGSSGITLNLLTLIALFKVKYHQIGPHLILLKSLAFADFMVCVLAVLKTTSKPHLYPDEYWTREPHWSTCLFDAVFEQCSFAYIATFLTLILIAVNQYVAITKALRYNQLVTGRRLGAAVALVWIVSLLIHCIDLFRALIISLLSDAYDDRFCFILKQFKTWERVAVPWKVFAALVGVGLIALCVIYIKIFIAAKLNLKRTEELSSDIINERRSRQHMLHTSLLLLGTFLLVYVPYCAVYATQEVHQMMLSEKNLEANSRIDAAFIKRGDPRHDCPECVQNLEENFKLMDEALAALAAVETQLKLITSYMEPVLLLNSIGDPLIYMIRLTSIRKVYKQLVCYFCENTSGGI